VIDEETDGHGHDAVEGAAFERHRCYTAHRKMQSFIGRVPGGGKLPLGLVLTLLQAGVLGVGIFVMFKTLSWWGPIAGNFGAPGYLVGIFGLPGVIAALLRKPKVGGRWVWQAGFGLMALAAHQVRDRSESRRGGRGVRVGRRVWVTD
jgi:hypothetical protein